ncbi:MAG: 23S rRNA (guanosine(2251)-2'-O)-methyltransferase RlmB [Bacteroidales bacterium]
MATETIIYGFQPVLEAFKAGKPIEKLLILNGLHPGKRGALTEMARQTDTPFQFVPKEKLNKISRGNHQGVIAFLAPLHYAQLDRLVPTLFESGRAPLLLMLDRITDVRNLGAIARTAECMGVDALIVPQRGSALIGPDAVKTSAGALNHIPVCREKNLQDTVKFLKESGFVTAALTEKGDKTPDQADLTKPVLLIAGSEENGIAPSLLGSCDLAIRIPMSGNTTSLNVSVATGMILYEVIRQRNKNR